MRHDLPCKTPNSTLHATTPDSTFFGLYKKDCRHTSLSRLPYCCRVPKRPSYCKKRTPHSPAIGLFTIETGQKRILPRTFPRDIQSKQSPAHKHCHPARNASLSLLRIRQGCPAGTTEIGVGERIMKIFTKITYMGGGKSATITNFEAERRMCPTDRGTRPHKN